MMSLDSSTVKKELRSFFGYLFQMYELIFGIFTVVLVDL